jgi:hypothetical protein
MNYLNNKKYPLHKNCTHYQDDWCKLNRIKVDPNGPICPRFTPKFRNIDSNINISKGLDLKILENKLNNIQRKIRYLKVKINDLK